MMLLKAYPLAISCHLISLTRNGLFMMRSASKLPVTQSLSPNKGTSSDDSNMRHFWRRIWSIPMPHKIHHFVWRACCNALPTKNNLLRSKITQEELCKDCKGAPKTVVMSSRGVRKQRRLRSVPSWCYRVSMKRTCHSRTSCGNC